MQQQNITTIPSFISVNPGPSIEKYEALNEYIDGLDEAHCKTIAVTVLQEVFRTEHTIFGHALEKPFGYAGDYLLIEKIYKQHISHDDFQNWDNYFHSHVATQAVRNRKKYFIQKMKELNRSINQPFRVLILGSGPATDVSEYLTETNAENVHFDLLDIDQRAIDYASVKNQAFSSQLTFIKSNVLRFSTPQTYDLIWSAGLFDYLDDRQFSFLIKRFYGNLNPGGRMIIGNFSLENPTRKIMEVFTEWFLNHRSPDHLVLLAEMAGMKTSDCTVEKEDLGVNLFLNISR